MNHLLTIIILITFLNCIIFPCESAQGKATHFLERSFVKGPPPGVPEEEIGDGDSVNTAQSQKVLYGHYTVILENGALKPKPGKEDLSSTPPHVRQYLKMVKLIELYRKNLHKTIRTAVDLTSGPETGDFQIQLESCQDQIKKCEDLGDQEITCAIECLSKGSNLLTGLQNVLSTVIRHFCNPIDTIFEKFFNGKGAKHPSLRKFWLFLQRFSKPSGGYAQVGTHGAGSLVPLAIQKIKTDMMPFRLLLQQLDLSLKAEQLLHPGPKSNPGTVNNYCGNVDDTEVASKLVDILYRSEYLVDASLEGLTAMNLVSKYVPGRFQTVFAAASEGVKVLTGTSCGLLAYSETGSVPSCDDIGGFPVPGIPIPAGKPYLPSLNLNCFEGKTVNGEDLRGSAEDVKILKLLKPQSGDLGGSDRRKRNQEGFTQAGSEALRGGKVGSHHKIGGKRKHILKPGAHHRKTKKAPTQQ